jgi:hypothetical protein
VRRSPDHSDHHGVTPWWVLVSAHHEIGKKMALTEFPVPSTQKVGKSNFLSAANHTVFDQRMMKPSQLRPMFPFALSLIVWLLLADYTI